MKRRSFKRAPSVLGHYGVAAAAVATALAVRWLLDPVLQTYAPYLPFTLAVMVAGRFGGRGPGLAATAASVLCSWYFLLEPRFSFLATPAQLASLALFAVVGAGISVLTGQLHQALDTSRRGESQLRRFTEFAAAHPGVQPGPQVMLAVSDTGTGMSPEVQAHVFEPFFTTKEAGKGTGLGLSTVYGIIKQSGGCIWIDSEPGRGSTFYMVFPVTAATAETAPSELPRPKFSGAETILLVEDEAGLRKYLRQALERHGYRVMEAASGRQALDLARAHSGDIHLLLTDMVMPEMGGVELAALFSHGPRATPVLCMSGYSDRVWQPACPTAGFIQKPFTIDALMSRIRHLLAAPAAERLSEAARAGPEQPA